MLTFAQGIVVVSEKSRPAATDESVLFRRVSLRGQTGDQLWSASVKFTPPITIAPKTRMSGF
jgi:hypothetical protein